MKKSVKRRLIEAYDKEIEELESQVIARKSDRRSLLGRGSGPLPWWAKEAARERGIA